MDPAIGKYILVEVETKKYKFIDDSGATTNPTVNQGGRVFNIVSGSITNGVVQLIHQLLRKVVVHTDYFILI